MRAFPNKFPALDPAEGVHEVVVSAPQHIIAFADLPVEQAALAIGAWADRLRAVAEDPRDLWPFWFLNQGAPAGASLQHSHAQVMGLPFSPPRLVTRARAFAEAEECPLCADLRDPGNRFVDEVDGMVAWLPRVPPLSATVRLAPRRHAPEWDEGLDRHALARALIAVLGRITRGFSTTALNLWLHQRRPGHEGDFHWHIEAVPRVGTLAGLELGAGVVAAGYTPEAAAARLREAGP